MSAASEFLAAKERENAARAEKLLGERELQGVINPASHYDPGKEARTIAARKIRAVAGQAVAILLDRKIPFDYAVSISDRHNRGRRCGIIGLWAVRIGSEMRVTHDDHQGRTLSETGVSEWTVGVGIGQDGNHYAFRGGGFFSETRDRRGTVRISGTTLRGMSDEELAGRHWELYKDAYDGLVVLIARAIDNHPIPSGFKFK